MSKISELSDGGSLLPTDFLIAVRSGGNVKVQADQTEFDRIRLGDNEKIELGNSQDLELYHSSTQSIINQAGVGDLLIQKGGVTKLTVNSTGIDVTGVITTDGLTTSADINFGDSDKAIFGAGSDLEIYHSGSNSYIVDSGTGSLYVQGSSNILLGSTTQSNLIIADGGAVTARYAGDNKLATTATGIDVTGSVTADGLTVSKASGDIATLESTTADSDVEANLLFNPVYDVNARIVSAREGSALASTLAFETGVDNTGSTVKRQHIASNGDISFFEDTGTTPKLVWKSSDERLGVGTSAPEGKVSVMGDLHVGLNTSVTGRGLVVSTSNTSVTDDTVSIDAQYSTGVLNFKTGGSTALTINASGALLLHPNNATRGLKITSTTTGTAGDTTTYDTVAAGYGKHIFKTDGVEAMRISDGNLLVGKTANNNSAVGVSIRPNEVSAVRDGGNPLLLNRLTSDGDLAVFRKDGTNVGSIGTAGGQFNIGLNTTSGLQFGTSLIYPRGTGNTTQDGTIDLGNSGNRFKDLYLSGGAYLGGTAAANKLDDVENGTFTAFFAHGSSPVDVGSSYAYQTGVYRKVGNVVYYIIDMDATISTTTTGYISVHGLPFTSGNSTTSRFPVATDRDCSSVTVPSGSILSVWVNANTTHLYIQSKSLTGNNSSNITSWDSSGRFNVSGFYFTS